MQISNLTALIDPWKLFTFVLCKIDVLMVFLSAHMLVRPLADRSRQGRAVRRTDSHQGVWAPQWFLPREKILLFFFLCVCFFFHQREDKQSDTAAGRNLEISVLLAAPTLRQ